MIQLTLYREDEIASENEKETQAWQSGQIKNGAFQHGTHKVEIRKERAPVPPLPKLSESISRLKNRHEKLEKQKVEYLESLATLTAEMDRIKEKEDEAQAGLNQAGLNYQFAKVELDSRQASASTTAPGTPLPG